MKKLVAILLLIFNLLGCTKQVVKPVLPSEQPIGVEKRENILTKLTEKAKQTGINILLLPGTDDSLYKDIVVKGNTVQFAYNNMIFVESGKELKSGEIIGGSVVKQKQVILVDRSTAKWVMVSNHVGNAESTSAGLSFSRFGTNVAILVSKEPIDEALVESIAVTVLPRLVTQDNQLFLGDYFESSKLKRGTQFDFLNGWKTTIESQKTLVVETGGRTADRQQGLVLVIAIGSKGKIISQQLFDTPDKHGPIMITAFNNFNLTVMAADGYKWIFNPFDGFRNVPQ